jgi:hypothetical protein
VGRIDHSAAFEGRHRADHFHFPRLGVYHYFGTGGSKAPFLGATADAEAMVWGGLALPPAKAFCRRLKYRPQPGLLQVL